MSRYAGEPSWWADAQRRADREDDWIDLTEHLDPLVVCQFCGTRVLQSAVALAVPIVCTRCYQASCLHDEQRLISPVESQCVHCGLVRIIKLSEPVASDPIAIPAQETRGWLQRKLDRFDTWLHLTVAFHRGHQVTPIWHPVRWHIYAWSLDLLRDVRAFCGQWVAR